MQDANAVKLFSQYWSGLLKTSPALATFVGVYDYNDRLSDSAKRSSRAWKTKIRRLKKSLIGIKNENLSDQVRISKDLLLDQLTSSLEWVWPSHHLAVDQMKGVHTNFLNIARVHPFRNEKDICDYVSRLRQFPAQIRATKKALIKGIKKGWTLPKNIVQITAPQIRNLVKNPESSLYLTMIQSKLNVVGAKKQNHYEKKIKDLIYNEINPCLQDLCEFMEERYIHACRNEIGLSSLPGGKKYYQKLVKQNTTLDFSAFQIHQIGIQEVQRIHGQIQKVQSEIGFSGSLCEFFEFMRQKENLHYKTREEIVKDHQDILKKMDEKLPLYFSVLPKNPYEVLPTPEYQEKQSPDAFYMPGDRKNGRAGIYYVNTFEPHTRARFNAEALAYHEAVPGHHLQISIAQELENLPEFRKRNSCTAYLEGWALYSEKLSEEMGFYRCAESRFGRLCFEVWRAARLVVDTGIHALGWTRDQAITFMRENTGLSLSNIAVEVDRYIVMPAQALSYKMGEMFLLNLREKVKKELGEKFDLRWFHDRVLENGALPLDVLEKTVMTRVAKLKELK